MNINYIEAKDNLKPMRKKVAAYARVSSDKDMSLHSLSFQVSYYSALIQRNPEWQYAGVYADAGITGTKASRPEFQRMMADCRNGNIDLILTKSLSRFARNTVTTLSALRELKDNGVDVWFERENLHSLSGDGELLITILSSYAQEESLSASENQKWKIRKNFAEGKPTYTRLMGYVLIGDTFVVISEEAETVRKIFNYYLSGMGLTAIAKKLNEEGVPTMNGGRWCETVLRGMLENEKYTGDLLLQKTFVVDHISKKQKTNTGELPQILITDDHEAIIDRDTFAQVQEEIARRAKRSSSSAKPKHEYEFTGKILCEQCGKNYRRKVLQSGKVVWICGTFNRLGKSYCASQQIPEDILKQTIGSTVFSEIRIPCANTIKIVQPNGEVIVRTWENPSRAESWTPEMRQQARERAIEWQKRT